MTLKSSRSMLAYFMNLSMNVPYKGHVPRLYQHPWEDMETSLHVMWGKAVCGTSQAQCFAWMAGLGRLFANLAEWGQRFMATPGPLEMLGAFLLVFTPNKKQFPLFKRQIFFFCFGRLVGFGVCLVFAFKIKWTLSFKAEGNRKGMEISQVTEQDKSRARGEAHCLGQASSPGRKSLWDKNSCQWPMMNEC